MNRVTRIDLVVMIPTSVVGTISNWRAKNVDVPTGLALGVAATIASVPGAWLALTLPPQLSSILFGLLLIAVAGQLTWKAIAAQRASRKDAAAHPSR